MEDFDGGGYFNSRLFLLFYPQHRSCFENVLLIKYCAFSGSTSIPSCSVSTVRETYSPYRYLPEPSTFAPFSPPAKVHQTAPPGRRRSRAPVQTLFQVNLRKKLADYTEKLLSYLPQIADNYRRVDPPVVSKCVNRTQFFYSVSNRAL